MNGMIPAPYGCVTATGTEMYRQHQGLMVDFLLGTDGSL